MREWGMLRFWPAVLAILVCILSCAYGWWRRRRGSPVKARERIWFALLVPVICVPALFLPWVFASPAMTASDRVVAALAIFAVGAAPLGVGLCFAGAMRLVRLYIAGARSAAEARTKGDPR
jgi:hypothetical protein